MAGIAVTDLPSASPDPAATGEAEVRTPDPAFEDGGDADALAS